MSKNRPMQLEACLRSLKTYFNEYQVSKKAVIFKATDKEYIDAYKIVIAEYQEVNFINETVYKKNVLDSIDQANKFTIFIMDDILFKNNFSLNDKPFQIMVANGKENVLSVSLRLHKGINYCYATDKNSRIPTFSRDIINEASVWKYYGCDGDWGYGYSLDANVYFTDYITHLIQKLDFYNPNTLEAVLNDKWHTVSDIKHPAYLICYPDKAKMINVPANRVQSVYLNRYENSYTEKELNDLFFKGNRISLDNTKDINTNSVHYPIKYEFIGKEKD